MKRISYGSIFFCLLLRRVIDFFPSNFAHAQSRIDYITDPTAYYTTIELICADGYPAQEHKVVTEDGYILTLHRIPNGRRRSKVPRRKSHYFKAHKKHHPDFDVCVQESLHETSTGNPVLLAHGLLLASDGWVLQGPGYDLAYMLADAGYDVWMPNIRGNFYSREHTTLKPSNPKFWDFRNLLQNNVECSRKMKVQQETLKGLFKEPPLKGTFILSFHENGYYDMPACIDYILNKVNREKIFFIGISMGTTIFFSMASSRPEYQDKILGFMALAPVVFAKREYLTKRRKTPLDVIMRVVSALDERGDVYELFPRTGGSMFLSTVLCSKGSRLQDICYDLTSPLIGYHSKLFLRSKLHLYYSHAPTGTSVKTLLHYSQNIKASAFRWFDYGVDQNLVVYGTPTPPDYAIWNIQSPVALYYCEGDFFYDIKDEKYLEKLLPNVVDVNVLKNFNHGDYLWAYKAKDLVYSRILVLMKRLEDNSTVS